MRACDTAENWSDPQEPGRGRLSASARVEAFTDGVLANVITLLVLSLGHRTCLVCAREGWDGKWPLGSDFARKGMER